MGSTAEPPVAEYDVVIIGAGVSGINNAYRLQQELPEYSYTIFESRKAIGGTWDLFKYPGVRSDSDLYTYSFPWRSWPNKTSIADGDSILEYIRGCAKDTGIDRKIQFEHKLLAADWSSEEASWTLSIECPGKSERGERDIKTFKANFVFLSTGYFDYSKPLKVDIPNLSDFKGTVIHPQSWPSDLDYADKKIVVIGSGATAITLVPVLAETASKVTMLQRSPSYILSLPSKAFLDGLMRKLLPTWLSNRILRWKNLILPSLFLAFCKNFPKAAKKVVRAETKPQLPPNIPLDPHFNPSYYPWEQRLCISRDGDFFAALREGKADIVTDTIDSVTPAGIRTTGGQELHADIIITATGLQVLVVGGAAIRVDGELVDVNKRFIWHTAMIQGVPNAAVSIGYTNNSWTLGADTTAILICRVLKYMRRNGFESATPSISGENPAKLQGKPLSGVKFKSGGNWTDIHERSSFPLSSTYIDRAKFALPKAGDRGPWLPRGYYFSDLWTAVWGSVAPGLNFVGTEKKRM